MTPAIVDGEGEIVATVITDHHASPIQRQDGLVTHRQIGDGRAASRLFDGIGRATPGQPALAVSRGHR